MPVPFYATFGGGAKSVPDFTRGVTYPVSSVTVRKTAQAARP